MENVGARWNAGNLEIYTLADGVTIFAFNAGQPITKTAAQLNALPIVSQPVIAAISTADATSNGVGYVQVDVNSIETLANANKAKINAILAALKTANIIASA